MKKTTLTKKKKKQPIQNKKILLKSSATVEQRKKRLHALLRELKKLFPKAEMALEWSTHFELLVAVMLSAQCTDKKVNEVTEKLFKKYPTIDAYAHAEPTVFEQDIHATGFYKNKTKNVLAAANVILKDFGGKVPKTMEEMLTIPGVARKTANVVLGNAYGVVEGIAVDTHVKRFCIRYNLVDSSDPVKIEQTLMELLPKKEWFTFTYRVIEYGRTIAPARKYDTSKDPLVSLYPKAGTVFRV
jgi:endonuclease III